MGSTSSKLSRWAYFLIAQAVSITLIYLLANLLVHQPTIKLSVNCSMLSRDELSCKFSCNLVPECFGEIDGRIVVLHFNWVAIYDNTTSLRCRANNTFEIDLPRRNYSFKLRAAVYGEEYGISYTTLEC
ncbi:MAG: hypothetical protein QW507_02585 [Candidatus Nanoarchaeia archaeon]|nr:hypothetical protein [Candidatus Haiyanarchaeum thermophilum]MCW1303351.1 hypothetical protein [Candidatus Haiyanarchaeum thermophilum]MCW1304067.1 hypothetical protein [Candidatus Haiyanarchaeum thermophilum]MCW1306511.1 hypothetical protein [Candidatus Haiyanarchaeum thermophilum]MCW1307537.1 hypothetical protein [Candidatus Haiyanarchaeum thermophilum]